MLFNIYIIVLLIISVITYFLYALDKKRAIKEKRRISEKTLLLFSFFLGATGGIIAMYTKRHKTKHWYFVVINFLSLVIHIYLGIVLFKL